MPRVEFTEPARRPSQQREAEKPKQLRCWMCGEDAEATYRWDDGLSYAGSLCEEHARVQAEAVDKMKVANVELWEAFASVTPAAKPEAERLRREYTIERTKPPEEWAHLREPVPKLDRKLHEAFLTYQDSQT